MKPQTAKGKKLVQQIITLIVILVLIGAFTILKFGAPKAVAIPKTQSLQTGFDTKAIDTIDTKDSAYPDVTPNKAELGKSDPFTP